MDITHFDLRQIARQIGDKKSLITRKDQSGTETHALTYKQIAIVCVFDPITKGVITFLPIEAILAGNQARRIKYRRDNGKA